MDKLILPETKGCPSLDDILNRMDPPTNADGRRIVREAYEFAQEAHKDQKRKSGEPYFIHPARVAWLLAGLINDPATIAAGLLHDTVEDCGVTMADIKSRFADPIPLLVDGVTKISTLNFSSDKENQVNNLRKMILAMAQDVRVVIVKLCDRLHNMLTLEHMSPAKQKEIAQSTIDIYAPLANRLGMTRIRALLEDLAMRYLQPSVYSQLKHDLTTRQYADQKVVDAIRRALQIHLARMNISTEIQGRRKHIFSIHQKMLRQGLRFDEVHDIIAIRVICSNVMECYEVLGAVHALWKPISGKFKDYIASPKENGYQSIHTSVIDGSGEIMEVQIRTQEMHREAEEGIAAHWRYKENGHSEGGPRGGDEEKRLAWLRQLVEWLQDIRDPSEFMRELKHDVFEASVFCYTPRGDIIEVPRGSTALDLAYRIHTDLGHRCAGARVNHRMASIRTELQTGDVVEIITSKNAHPTSDWLQIVCTGRARNKIRHWLKESQHGQYLDQGRRALSEAVRGRFGSQVDEAQVIQILEPHLKSYSCPTFEDLLVELGCGTIKIGSLVARLEQILRPPEPRRIPKATRQQNKKHKDLVLVEGMSGAVTRMAQCCSPLPGEPIVGFITQGRGITVHREDCRSLENIKTRANNFESRLLKVQWSEVSHQMQKVAVRMICLDRKGLLSDVTTAITQMNVNITGSFSETNPRDNRATIKLTMLVNSSDELSMILNRIAQVPGVVSIKRVVTTR